LEQARRWSQYLGGHRQQLRFVFCLLGVLCLLLCFEEFLLAFLFGRNSRGQAALCESIVTRWRGGLVPEALLFVLLVGSYRRTQ